MVTKEKTIKVVFRKYKNGEIIALFPEIPWNTHNYTTTSYMHLSQHGSADYAKIIVDTDPANLQEYRPLLLELKSIGYKDLRTLKRAKPLFR